MAIQVGCTGWSYPDWYKNGFYDRKEEVRLKQGSELNYHLWKYSKFFSCTEINSFNYMVSKIDEQELQRLNVGPKAIWWYKKELEKRELKEKYSMFESLPFITKNWDQSTPEDFIFSAKVPGMITHAKCLRDCAVETTLFLKGIHGVSKMKYLLYEFPSYFTKKEFFDDFLDYFSRINEDYHYVVEFRSADWQEEEVFDFIRKKQIILALSEVNDKGVRTIKENIGTEFYVRIIGEHGIIQSFGAANIYEEKRKVLNTWAKNVSGGDAFVFINNNFAGNAPETANYFKKLVGEKPKEWKMDLRRFG